MAYTPPFVKNTESNLGTYYVLFGDNTHGAAVPRTDTDLRYDTVDGKIFAKVLQLEAPDGTPPLQVSSTSMIQNLNTEMVGGYRHTDFIKRFPKYTSTTATTAGYYRVATIPISSTFKNTMFKIKAYTALGTLTESTVIINIAYRSDNYGSQYSAISANTSHSYNSRTTAENGWVLLYCRVSFDANYGYIDFYKYKSTVATIEIEPMVESDWEFLTGSLTYNPPVGSLRNTIVTMEYGFRSNSLSAGYASYSSYTSYGVLGTNTLSNTTDKSNKWAYIGNFYLEYSGSYLRGRSGNVRIRLQELSFDGLIPPGDLDDFVVDFRVNLAYHANNTEFNSLSPTISTYIEGKTSLQKTDIAALVYSTSTSVKYIRLYVKLKSANTVYAINPEQRYGRSFATTTYSQTTSYCYFNYVGDETPIDTLPTPAQGSVVYAEFLTPNIRAIEAISETAGFLKKTGEDTWALDNSTYSLSTHTHDASAINSGTLSGNRGVQAGSSTVSFITYHGTSNSVGGTFYGGTTNPTGETRLNYNGILYATKFNAVSSPISASAASHYIFEVGSDGNLLRKTLANVRDEVVIASDILTKIKTVDGDSSGLDSDLLEGYHGSSSATASTYVLRDSSAGITVGSINSSGANFSGLVTIDKSVAGDGGWNQAGLMIKNNNSSTGEVAVSMQNASTGTSYWIQGLNQSDIYKFIYGSSFTDTYTKVTIDTDGQIWQGNSANKYWHAGNDGLNSGLDADLVQGRNSATGNTVNTLVYRDASGNFAAGTITAALAGNASTATKLATARNIALSGDVSGSANFDGSANITISATISDDSHNHIISNVDGLQTALDAKLPSSSYTAADVLAKIKTVDGLNSGLDADLFQGVSKSAIVNADNNYIIHDNRAVDTPTDIGERGVKFEFKGNSTDGLTDGGTYHGIMTFQQWSDSSGGTIHQLGMTDNNNLFMRTAVIGGSWGNWNKFWHTGNGGVGSYLDADLLQGRNSATANTANTVVYRDGSGNFSAGTITAALSGNASTASKWATARTITLGGDLTGNVSIDGSANVTLTATVVDDSHNHIISNVDGLQDALDAKLPSSSYTASDILTKIKTVDGDNSGLDADLLQGRDSSSGNSANTVVIRDANGDFAIRAITNGTFSSGFGGSGGRFDYGVTNSNQSTLEVDNLIVRNKLNSYEMLVNQLRATNGGMFVSSIGKVVSASLSSGTIGALNSIYILTMDQVVTHGFAVGDLIRAKRWVSTGTYFDVKMEVTAVTTTSPVTITAKLKEANAYISAVSKFSGMEFVRIGNVSVANRQGSVYLTSDDANSPYIDILSGVNSHPAWGGTSTIKARFGNIGGLMHNGSAIASNTFGLWAGNAYLSGSIVANSGSIAGWTIGSDALYKDVTSGSEGVGMSPATGSSTTVFWAGTTYQYRELTPWETYGPGFKVTDTGQLYAKNAYISGTGQNSVGIGLNVNSSGNGSIAMGASAESTALNAIALGYGASATGINSIAIGIDSAALSEKSMAIGSYAESGAVNGIALGYSASAAQLNSIAIGVNSTASWDSSMAIGTIAESTQLNSIALGYGSSSTGFNSLAIGAISKATWENSVAIGTNSLTFAPDGVAIGSTAKAIGSADIAIGASAMSASSYTSNRKNNIGIGKSALNVISDAEDNIGIGTESGTSLTTGDMNIGIGRDSIKTLTIGSSNIGIGTLALTGVTTGSNNIAIGNGFGEQFFNAADSNKMWLGNNMDETWISGKTTFLKGYQIILADQTQTVKSISVDSGVLEIIGNTNATIRANSVNVGNTSTTQTVIKSVDKEISLPSGAGSVLVISNTTGVISVTASSFNIVNNAMKLGQSSINSTATGAVTINYPNAGGTVALVRYADAATALTGASTAPSNGQLLIGNGTNYTRATLTSGVGMAAMTNNAGSISVNLGTPSTLTASTTNSASGTTHYHAIAATDTGSSSALVKTGSDGSLTAANTFKFGANASMKYNSITKSIDFIFS